MDGIKEGWFAEFSPIWPGECKCIAVKNVLYQKKSKYQDILVFESETYGRILCLDGVIQVSERDEFAYQEMMTHIPLNCHPNPESVLLIGGGDGGVLREIAKDPRVKRIVQCELDEDVIRVSKEYLPSLAVGFEDSRVEVNIEDGFVYLGDHKKEFDVIITDSSDPVGPAECLFKVEYYQLMKDALKDGGICCSQGESIWLHLDLVQEVLRFTRELFTVVDYSTFSIPTYPSGTIGALLCSKNPATNFALPVRDLSEAEVDKMKLRYYNTEVHRASFVLPQFAKKALMGK